MSALQIAKFWLIDAFGLGKDALHIYVGLLVLFGSAALFGRRIGQWLPLACVVLVAIIGEIWDIRDRIVLDISVDPQAHWHDLWNTIFWPAVLSALARTTRLFEPPPPDIPEA